MSFEPHHGRARRAGTSISSQTRRSADGSRASPSHPADATTKLTSATSLNQTALARAVIVRAATFSGRLGVRAGTGPDAGFSSSLTITPSVRFIPTPPLGGGSSSWATASPRM